MNVKHLGATALVSLLLTSGAAFAQEAPATDTAPAMGTTTTAGPDAAGAAGGTAGAPGAMDPAAPAAMDPAAPAATDPTLAATTPADVEEDDADFPWGLLGLLGLAGLLGLKRRDDDDRTRTTTR
jgi:MYXO-CTERM domain-containing protein